MTSHTQSKSLMRPWHQIILYDLILITFKKYGIEGDASIPVAIRQISSRENMRTAAAGIVCTERRLGHTGALAPQVNRRSWRCGIAYIGTTFGSMRWFRANDFRARTGSYRWNSGQA